MILCVCANTPEILFLYYFFFQKQVCISPIEWEYIFVCTINMLKDRLSTRNILRRRNMHLPSYSCILCNLDVEEISQHLFLQCQFAKQCWQFLQIHIPSNADFSEVMLYLKDSLHSRFFMAAVVLLCCAIWCSRNDFIFKGL